MHIRITTGRYDTSHENEVRTMAETTVLSAARQLPGFKSYKGGLNANTGRLVVVTTWETGEQAQGFRDKLGSDIIKQIQDLGIQLDESQVFESVIEA
jgi:heme-degrading monooxygenase HmoA